MLRVSEVRRWPSQQHPHPEQLEVARADVDDLLATTEAVAAGATPENTSPKAMRKPARGAPPGQ
jgi:hypothetical protein